MLNKIKHKKLLVERGEVNCLTSYRLPRVTIFTSAVDVAYSQGGKNTLSRFYNNYKTTN